MHTWINVTWGKHYTGLLFPVSRERRELCTMLRDRQIGRSKSKKRVVGISERWRKKRGIEKGRAEL